MKHSALFTVFIFALTIFSSSCKEDEYADWKIKNEQWLLNYQQAHKNDNNFFTTSSGLSYRVIHQGGQFTRRPTKSSTVIVTFKGTLIDVSSFGSGTKDTLYLGGTVKGWQEGITKMNSGGTYRFYIPSSLGYNSSTSNAGIPPYSTLIYEVDLINSQN
jgi:FKBP-type peptidyl-prolyl cis-trans isomerase